MLFEIVRPGTFSRGLTMQLLLGNAVEVLLLMQAGVDLEASELQTLRDAAAQLVTGSGLESAVASSAVNEDSVEVVTAAQTAFRPDTTAELRTRLQKLAGALVHVADSGTLENLKITVEELVRELIALRDVLSARSAVAPDEVHGLTTG